MATDQRQTTHDILQRLVGTQGATSSELRNGVSVHRLGESLSFTNVGAQLLAVSGLEPKLFIGCIEGSIVVSLNFNHEPPEAAPAASLTGKKRRVDPEEEQVQAAVERVRKGLAEGSEITEPMLEAAQAALVALLKTMRGSNGERAIESWGLNAKQPERANGQSNGHANGAAPTAPARPKLILSARLSPGIAVSLDAVKRALGTTCFADGMFTVQSTTSFAAGFQLPLSDHAQVAEAAGQRSVMLLATVGER